MVVARGCDAWTEYTCFSSRRGPVCIREGPARVARDSASRNRESVGNSWRLTSAAVVRERVWSRQRLGSTLFRHGMGGSLGCRFTIAIVVIFVSRLGTPGMRPRTANHAGGEWYARAESNHEVAIRAVKKGARRSDLNNPTAPAPRTAPIHHRAIAAFVGEDPVSASGQFDQTANGAAPPASGYPLRYRRSTVPYSPALSVSALQLRCRAICARFRITHGSARTSGHAFRKHHTVRGVQLRATVSVNAAS